jgi:hypothetical protein
VSSIERAVAVLWVGVMLAVPARGVAAGAPGQSDVHALLDVPYVSQTPELCGGAAVAMVLRYWGARDVFPQDFARLVATGDQGILTSALASSVRDRGWQAVVVPADDATARARIRSEIDRGRPLIALIEVGPRTYHYVVIVGSTDHEVVVHDPARAPFRVLGWADFDRAWAATGRWTMLVLPPGGLRSGGEVARVAPASSAGPAVHSDATPCAGLVDRAVQLALAGDRDGAEQGLVAATRLCPNDPASWRELAGLRFSQARWSEAQDLALSAARLAPDDAYLWQLVASSRYLLGDVMGALDAWNRTGEPRIDGIDIHGAERTRHPVVVRATAFEPRQVLTREAFGRALRRLRDLPVVSNAQMGYTPIDGGFAKVGVVITERKVAPAGWRTFAILGARAGLLHELRVDVAGPLGAGELVRGAWRWSAGRPRVALGVSLPAPPGLPGVLSIEGSWERQSYDATPASDAVTLVREERRRVGLQVADWPSSWFRWQAGGGLDRLRQYTDPDTHRPDARDYLALDGTLDVRLAGDRLALAASGGWWAPFAGGDRFRTGGLLAAWRSTAEAARPLWSAVTEIGMASGVAPLALWSGAGTGQGRSGLLRAHKLINGGVLTGPVFGRGVARGSLEYARPVGHKFAGALSIAGFVDAARAWHRLTGLGASPLYVDAGVGVRLHAPGPNGAIRIDLARGLRGGGTTLSASWGGAWPR